MIAPNGQEIKAPNLYRGLSNQNCVYLINNTVAEQTYLILSVDFFHILDIREYWFQTESKIPLKPMLGCVRIVVLSNISHDQTK